MKFSLRTLLIVAATCLCANTSQAAPYSYATYKLQLTDMGAGLNPTAINNVGQVVGQAGNSQAFLWSGGVTTPLGTVGGTQSYANDINDNGVAVGWSLDGAGAQKAFSWQSGVMTNRQLGSTLTGAAESISNNNEIVGWRTNGTIIRSAEWTDAVPLGTSLFAFESGNLGNHRATGVDKFGHIVAVVLDASGHGVESYYYDGLGSNSFFTDTLGTVGYLVAGLNNFGETFGSVGSSGAVSGFGAGNITPIDKLAINDDFAATYGLNDSNQAVGTSGEKGFLYDVPNNLLFDINLFPRQTPGFGQVLSLTDINNDGTFVGVALVGGIEHGIVGQLVPVPEPSTWAPLSLGSLR